MAPDWLSSTYKGYKTDTNTFTTWLMSAALELGYNIEADIAVPNPNTSMTRGKNKASRSGGKASEPIIKVTVKQLWNQANFLVGQQSKVLVPRSVIQAANRAIGARRTCCEWYSYVSADEDIGHDGAFEEDNQRHQYFIKTLEDILDILKPIYAPSDVSTESEHQKPKTKAHVNVYELLEVDDSVDDEPLSLSELTVSRPPPIKKPVKQKAVPNTDSNWLFKAFCAFQDFNDIRKHIRRLWEGYRDGKVDLITASMVTDVAFILMKEIEQESLNPQVNGKTMRPWEVGFAFLENCCRVRGQPIMRLLEKGPEGPMSDILEWLSLDIKILADQWTPGAHPSKVIFRHLHGIYDPSADRERLSKSEQLNEKVIIATHLVVETSMVQKFEQLGYTLLIRDMVTEEFAELVDQTPEGKTLDVQSLWICAAVQILVDIHLVLRVKIERPCKEMRIVAKLSRSVISGWVKFRESPPIKPLGLETSWTSKGETDPRLESLDMLLQNVEDDALGKLKTMAGINLDNCETVPDAPFSQNPVLCGKYTMAVYLDSQDEGLRSADLWWHIMPMAHLYNALKQNGFLSTKWQRMEKLIEIHTPEYIFYGGAPTNLHTCYSKIRLAKGLSADMSAYSARREIVHRTRPRRLFRTNLSPIFEALKAYTLPSPDESKGLELIQTLTRISKSETTIKSDTARKGLGALGLLSFFEDNLTKELPGIKFNYWALNEECITILHLLYQEFGEAFKGARENPKNSGYDRGEGEALFHIAEDIICYGAMAAGALRDSGMLRRAAQILSDSIKRK